MEIISPRAKKVIDVLRIENGRRLIEIDEVFLYRRQGDGTYRKEMYWQRNADGLEVLPDMNCCCWCCCCCTSGNCGHHCHVPPSSGTYGTGDENGDVSPEYNPSTDFIKDFSINAYSPAKDFIGDFVINAVDPTKDFVKDFTITAVGSEILNGGIRYPAIIAQHRHISRFTFSRRATKRLFWQAVTQEGSNGNYIPQSKKGY